MTASPLSRESREPLLTIRLTDTDLSRARIAADAQRVTVSAWIRNACYERAERVDAGRRVPTLKRVAGNLSEQTSLRFTLREVAFIERHAAAAGLEPRAWIRAVIVTRLASRERGSAKRGA